MQAASASPNMPVRRETSNKSDSPNTSRLKPMIQTARSEIAPQGIGRSFRYSQSNAASNASFRNMPAVYRRLAPKNRYGNLCGQPWPPNHHAVKQFDQTVGRFETRPRTKSARNGIGFIPGYYSRFRHRPIERPDQFLHRGLGLVAHVRNSKRRAFDLAVAAVNQKALVFYQLLQLRHIDGTASWLCAVVHAGECDRLEARVRKQIESVFRRPIPHHLIGLAVARVARVQSLPKELIQLRRQREHVSYARRAGRHVLLGIFLKFDEIKIIAAILHSAGFGECRGRTYEHRQPGRHGPSFLRSEERR